ncbi:MAG: hypothetical protein WKF84_09915 [Pyrinomonadaceae bacterium]
MKTLFLITSMIQFIITAFFLSPTNSRSIEHSSVIPRAGNYLASSSLNAEAKLQRYVEALFNGRLHPKARTAIPRIPDFGRRLVAIRGYLRSSQSLDAKWVWSPGRDRALQSLRGASRHDGRSGEDQTKIQRTKSRLYSLRKYGGAEPGRTSQELERNRLNQREQGMLC